MKGEGGFNADIAIWSPKLCVQIKKKTGAVEVD